MNPAPLLATRNDPANIAKTNAKNNATQEPPMTHTLHRQAHPFVPPLRRHAVAAATATALALALCSATAAPLDDIRRQVEASQFDQAMQTALANPQLIGETHFDFLYGVAAINTGRVAEGVLALERHLSAVPANDRARLELARGYFLLGDFARARNEFEFVLRYNPPAGVRSNINGFLQAMQSRESADRRATARLYIEAGGGYDNNVNGGTFRDQVDSPLGVLTTGGTASAQVNDSFAQVALGGQQTLRVSNRVSVFAGADLDVRGNAQEKAYDLATGTLYAGLTQLTSLALWRGTFSASQLQVGGNRYRNTLQVSAEANMTLSPALSLLGFAQYGDYRHATADQNRDARATVLGAMLTNNLSDLPWTPSLGARLSYVQEDNLRLKKDFSNAGPVLRVFASVSPLERLRVAAGLSASNKKYGGPDFVLGTVRRDQALSADLSVNYAIDANWSARADAAMSDTRSNQDLYDSRRKALSAKLRYQY